MRVCVCGILCVIHKCDICMCVCGESELSSLLTLLVLLLSTIQTVLSSYLRVLSCFHEHNSTMLHVRC